MMALGLMVLPSQLYADGSSSSTAVLNVQAKIIVPIQVAISSTLDFGEILGGVAYNTNGGVNAQGVSLAPVQLNVTGENNHSFSLGMASTTTMSNGTDTFPVTFKNASGQTLAGSYSLVSGSKSIAAHGSISATDTTSISAGVYTGTVTVTVTYT